MSAAEKLRKEVGWDDNIEEECQNLHELMCEMSMPLKPACCCSTCEMQLRSKDDQAMAIFDCHGQIESRTDIQDRADKMINSTTDNRAFIRRTILESGPSLLKKWRQSKAKRQYYLDSVEGLYPYANPLIQLSNDLHGKNHAEKQAYRAPCLLPYLNKENLNENACRFIRLLHYRAFAPLEDWIAFDNSQIQQAWRMGAFEEQSARGCIIMQGTNYGVAEAFDAKLIHDGTAYTVTRALALLEAQQRLFQCLRTIVEMLIQMPNDTLPPANGDVASGDRQIPCEKWMKAIEDRIYHDNRQLSFGYMLSERPFGRPPRFDIERMLDISRNRAAEAHDELWLLQTDLGFFHATLKYYETQWFDQTVEGSPGRPTRKEKFDDIGYIVTVKMVIHAREWQWLAEECENVEQEMVKSTGEGRKRSEISSTHLKALCSLKMLLLRADRFLRTDLKRSLTEAEAFKHLLTVTRGCQTSRGADGRIKDWRWGLETDLKDSSRLIFDDPLGWCLHQLCKDSDDIGTFDHHVIFEKIDRLLAKSARQQSRMSAELQRALADLMAVEQMLDILNMHRPYVHPILFSALKENRQSWKTLERFVQDPKVVRSSEYSLGSEVLPISKFAPPTGAKDRKWLTKRDEAHQSLSKLWQKARDGYQRDLESSHVPQWCIDPQLESMRQVDSPEITAFLDLELEQILSRLDSTRRRKVLISGNFTPTIFTSGPTTTGIRHQKQEPAAKKKTRPAKAQEDETLKVDALMEDTGSIEACEEAPTTPILYNLPQKDKIWKVLSLMFPADELTASSESPKRADWKDFLATFAKLGLEASHRGGSAFTFSGNILAGTALRAEKHSMNVHRPHPDTEMSAIFLRSIGKRCERRFGWRKESFAYAEA